MWRLIALLLLASVWPLSALAYPGGLFSSPLQQPVPDALQKLQKRLGQTRALELHFQQKKFLSELERPLISRGKLLIAPGLGVDWQVTEPFRSEWRIARDGRVLKGPQNGAAKPVASLLIGLFSGNTPELRSAFKLYWQQAGPVWWLGLKPKSPRLAKVIDHIAVSGDQDIRRVEIHEASGDRTVIKVTVSEAQALTQTLRKRFSEE